MSSLFTLGLAVLSWAAQPPSASIACRAERPAVVAGEPVVLVITVRNLTEEKLLVPTDSDSVHRVTHGPGGLELRPTPPPYEADSSTFFVAPLPGEERTIRVLAGETAQLRVPGEYRMTVGYPGFGATGEVRFTVLPYDSSALRDRAAEIHSIVFEKGDAGRSLLAKKALTVIEPAIAEPLLCSVLKRDPEELDRSVAYALGRSVSPAVADCLIEILPRGRDITKNSVTQILRRIEQLTPDSALRLRIREALAGN